MMQVSGGDNGNNQKLLLGVQGDGFLEKSPPGRRRQKKIWKYFAWHQFDFHPGTMKIWGEDMVPGDLFLFFKRQINYLPIIF
jgi:hypothetical protein